MESPDPYAAIFAYSTEATAVMFTLTGLMSHPRWTDPAWVQAVNDTVRRLTIVHEKVNDMRLPAKYQPAHRLMRRALRKARESVNLAIDLANAYPNPIPHDVCRLNSGEGIEVPNLRLPRPASKPPIVATVRLSLVPTTTMGLCSHQGPAMSLGKLPSAF
jgi:hypothetical protein